MAAAESAGRKVIGVDIDQSGQSPTVITSAMKGLTISVYDVIGAYYDGNFPGGQVLVFDAARDGVGLPIAASRFEGFSQIDYNEIFNRVALGEFDIPDENSADGVEAIPLDIVVVTEMK